MKSALAGSLKAEDDAVRMRFEKAESLLAAKPEQASSSEDHPSAPPLPEPNVSPAVEVQEQEKVVRDSFTLPSSDYELIASLKQRCLNSAVNVSKSEIIRAGLHALKSMSDEDLLAIVESLEKVKTGRPSVKKKQ